MDIFGHLGSIILFSFVQLLLTQICLSRLVVDLEVRGRYVVKTGVRAYVVRTPGDEDVLITCSTQTSVSGTILLLDTNGEIVANVDSSEDDTNVAWLRGRNPNGRYTCVLKISTWISSDSYSEFVVTSEVEITTVSTGQSLLCSSSVGQAGYIGEIATFTCNTVFHSSCYRWKDSYKRALEMVLTENVQLTCSCYYFSKTCSVSVLVSQSIKLNVSVIANGAQSNTMEFLCVSIPPRLMYWTVFGTYGNLLDLDKIGPRVNVNTTVNITQLPGETFLRISETIPGGNGIHTVMCSTYDTTKRFVAYLPVETPSESNFDIEPTITGIQDTTTWPTKTDVLSTLAITTTEKVENCEDFEIQVSTEQEYLWKTDTVDNYLLVGLVSLPYLVIITILLGTICFMHCRHKNSMQPSVAVPSQHIPSETILHENPAYLSLSETKQYSSENGNVEKTYANL